MKIQTWKLWLFSSICFLFCGILSVIGKKYFLGSVFIILSLSYICLSITYYKKDNKPKKIEVPDDVLKNMDIELKNLISKGKKFEAIKKYRTVTGIGLKEASDYIDSLSK